MEHVLGAVALLFALGVAVPQLYVNLVRGHWHGLSFAGVANSGLAACAWVAYGVLERDGWLVASSVVHTLAFGGIAVVMVVHAVHARRAPSRIVYVLVWAAALIAASALWPVNNAWLVGALTMGVWASSLPQLALAWRAPDTRGISITSWSVVVTEASLWLAYGWMRDLPALVTWGVSAIVLGVGIILGAARGLVASRAGTDSGSALLDDVVLAAHQADA